MCFNSCATPGAAGTFASYYGTRLREYIVESPAFFLQPPWGEEPERTFVLINRRGPHKAYLADPRREAHIPPGDTSEAELRLVQALQEAANRESLSLKIRESMTLADAGQHAIAPLRNGETLTRWAAARPHLFEVRPSIVHASLRSRQLDCLDSSSVSGSLRKHGTRICGLLFKRCSRHRSCYHVPHKVVQGLARHEHWLIIKTLLMCADALP